MKRETLIPVVISIILTAVIVWALLGFLAPAPDDNERIAELEETVEALTTENDRLNALVTDRDAQILILQSELDQIRSRIISLQPKAGWETYFPSHDTNTITGKTVAEVEELLGIPPVKIRSIAATASFNREIWIYMPYAEDPTGLYLYFKGNQLWRSRLDEFTGVYGSGLLEDEDFWVN